MHRIKIHQGKVASLKVDAIVNPLVVNSQVVDKAAQDQLRRESCLIGDVRIVPASEDRPNPVIEVIGPCGAVVSTRRKSSWLPVTARPWIWLNRRIFESIAFAPINGGAKGFPANRATKIAVQQVDSALRQNPLMEWVIFCCSDPVTTALYRTQVGR